MRTLLFLLLFIAPPHLPPTRLPPRHMPKADAPAALQLAEDVTYTLDGKPVDLADVPKDAVIDKIVIEKGATEKENRVKKINYRTPKK